MRLLGLGVRAGQVVVGVDRVRSALQAGRVACVVVAGDASPRARDKVVRLAAARGVPLVAGPPAATLGARLGFPPVMVAGVVERALARGMLGPAAESRSDGGVSGQDPSA
ncbi:MAG TPA: ribosomal L7Ae/L30e/S12e/Gadd45 family protein [Gemmatimonadales bacterium]|nr:ribosomal L7Ae/L30e/S12e/Gadd45 family protein [Gemmatimonadales bacterium]